MSNDEIVVRSIINGKLIQTGEVVERNGWKISMAKRADVTRAAQVMRAPTRSNLSGVLGALEDIGRKADWITDDQMQQIARCSGSPISFVRKTIVNINAWLAGIGGWLDGFSDKYGRHSLKMREGVYAPGGPAFLLLAGDSTSLGPWTMAHAMIAGVRLVAKPSNAEPLSTFLFAKAVADRGVLSPNILLLDSGNEEHRTWIRTLIQVGRQSILFGHDSSIANVHSGLPYMPGHCWHEYFSGRSGAVVLAGADLKQAAKDIVCAATVDRGNVCIATKWVLVPRENQEEFESDFLRAADEVVYHGDPLDEKTTLGRLDASDRKHAMSAAYGGRLLYDKHLIASRVQDGSTMLDTELPYPAVGIRYYDSNEDPVAIANRIAQKGPTQRALVVSVFSPDEKSFEKAAAELWSYKVYHNKPTNHFSYFAPHQGRHLCFSLMRRMVVE